MTKPVPSPLSVTARLKRGAERLARGAASVSLLVPGVAACGSDADASTAEIEVPAGSSCSVQDGTAPTSAAGFDWTAAAISKANNGANPVNPGSLPQVAMQADAATEADKATLAKFSTPDQAVENASLIGTANVVGVTYSQKGIEVDLQITGEDVNRTTSEFGDKIRVCYPHFVGFKKDANGKPTEELGLLVNPRFDLPGVVGTTSNLVLDEKGQLVPFLNMNFTGDVPYSNRSTDIHYPLYYAVMSQHWYGTPWTDNAIGPRSNTTVNTSPFSRSKTRQTLTRSTKAWSDKNNGLPASRAKEKSVVGNATQGKPMVVLRGVDSGQQDSTRKGKVIVGGNGSKQDTVRSGNNNNLGGSKAGSGLSNGSRGGSIGGGSIGGGRR